MPFTFNGVGTHYWGERNIVVREGACEACGKVGKLKSYETTLFFVVLFIPLIPLRKLRVFDQCLSCRRHRVMSMKQWQEARATVSEKEISKYREDPDNIEAIKECLGALVSLRDTEGLANFAREILPRHDRNPEVLTLLADAQGFLWLYKDAEANLRAALRTDGEYVPAKESLAEMVALAGRPDEAEQLAQHIIDRGEPDKAWLLYKIAESHQAIGNHAAALRLLNQCEALVPQIRQNKDFNKSRKLSEKLQGTNKPIRKKAKKLRSIPKSARSKSNASGKVALMVSPVLLLLALLGWLFAAWYSGQHREVYLVNGLMKPYSVRVNGGEAIRLHPGSPVPIEVREGILNIVPEPGDYEIEPKTVLVETGFFGRPIASPIFVINPDQAAMLESVLTHYYPKDMPVSQVPENVVHLLAGDVLVRKDHVDYVFERFPEKLQLSDNKLAKRTRLTVVDPRRWILAPGVVSAVEGSDAESYANLARAMVARFKLDPGDYDAMYEFCSMSSIDDATEVLQPFLDRRPIDPVLHEAWLNMAEGNLPPGELEAIYDELLSEYPNDPDVLFLRGRLATDPDEVASYYRRGIEAGGNNSECLYGMASLYHCYGESQQAKEYVEKAIAQEPDNVGYLLLAEAISLARRDYNAAFDYSCTRLGLCQVGIADIASQATYAKAAGREEDFKNSMRRAKAMMGEVFGASGIEALVAQQEERSAFRDGQYEEWFARWKDYSPGYPHKEMLGKMWYGETSDLGAIIQQAQDDFDLSDAALASVALNRAGAIEERDAMIERMVNLMGSTGEYDVLIAALNEESALPPEKLVRLECDPSDKKCIFLVLGELYPEHRDLYWATAKKLNSGFGPISLLVEKYTTQ
ncbi:hypothetical protein KQI84_09270 [bacterium]|nr:hypothetical protein [bacterium]